MDQGIKAKTVKKNLATSTAAQAVYLAVSFILGMVVPKLIPEADYACWQTYVLYAGYAGLLHFGLLDGILLRYTGYSESQLDSPLLAGQLHLLLGWTGCIALAAIAFSLFFLSGVTCRLVILIALSVITKNAVVYGMYLLQITNRIGKYAVLVISQRITYGAIVTALLMLRQTDYALFCLADICGDLIGCAVGFAYCKPMYCSRQKIAQFPLLRELRMNISAGILLLIANLSSVLLTNIARTVVQTRFGLLTFGRVSFAFSISSLFLTFVTALGVAFFPALKRMQLSQLPRLYVSVSETLPALLAAVLLGYYPGCAVLRLWIPKYQRSLFYLGLLLPSVFFTCRTSLLDNSYLKALRKEKQLFMVNTVSVAFAVILYLFCGYLLGSLTALVLSVVIAVAIRSVWSELLVSRTLNLPVRSSLIHQAVLILLFEISVFCPSPTVGWVIYSCGLAVYLFACRKKLFRRFQAEEEQPEP